MTNFRFLMSAVALAACPVAAIAQPTIDVAPSPAPAAQPSSPAPAAPAPKAQTVSYSDQVICKQEGKAGSRLGGRRMCHTRAKWDEINHYAADRTRAAQMQGEHMNPGG